MRADKSLVLALAPSGGALGITDIDVPTADELNNVGGASGFIDATPAVSYNDTDLGFQASEQGNEPSWADSSTYQELTTTNAGGNVSFYYPGQYDDPSNPLSNVYDITDVPGAKVDAAWRLDGEINHSVPFANGDFVSAMRLEVDGELNPFTPGESHRRTVPFALVGDFAHYTVVGPHTLTAIPATVTGADGEKGRIRVSVQSRDYTNALRFTSSNAAVIEVFRGGYYTLTGTGTATVTIDDVDAGTSTTVSVTVA